MSATSPAKCVKSGKAAGRRAAVRSGFVGRLGEEQCVNWPNILCAKMLYIVDDKLTDTLKPLRKSIIMDGLFLAHWIPLAVNGGWLIVSGDLFRRRR